MTARHALLLGIGILTSRITTKRHHMSTRSRITVVQGDKMVNAPGNHWTIDHRGHLTVTDTTTDRPTYTTKEWDRVLVGTHGDIFIKPDGFLVMRKPGNSAYTVVQVATEDARQIVRTALGRAVSSCWLSSPDPAPEIDPDLLDAITEDAVIALTTEIR